MHALVIISTTAAHVEMQNTVAVCQGEGIECCRQVHRSTLRYACMHWHTWCCQVAACQLGACRSVQSAKSTGPWINTAPKPSPGDLHHEAKSCQWCSTCCTQHSSSTNNHQSGWVSNTPPAHNNNRQSTPPIQHMYSCLVSLDVFSAVLCRELYCLGRWLLQQQLRILVLH